MLIQVDDAILLEVKEESFKGRDGKDVTYRKAKFIDDENNYHEATVLTDVEFDDDLENINRLGVSLSVQIDEVERNGNTMLKKRIVEVR